jgi:dTDP-4-dehydrorhamnose reductase
MTAAVPRKVLVFGANGQVGHELTRGQAPAGVQVIGLTRSEADITDGAAVRRAVLRHAPDVIVNAAAYTAVDKAESEPDRAFAANETGPRHLASAAQEKGVLLVHLSTDYVFDGRKAEPYVEDDAIAPTSVYGRSKAAGEQAVRAICARHLILRTAWVYAAHGHNFLRTMLRLARERDVVRVVADQHGTPTAAADIAQAIFALLPKLGAPDAAFGTFHLTNCGRTTWHGFAEAIFAELKERGLPAPRLEAITTADYPTPAQRPAMSVLDGSKLERAYGLRLRPWQAALRETMDALLAAEMERSSA